MKIFLKLVLIAIIAFALSCDDNSSDPNKIGGSTDIDLTKVGNEFGIYFNVPELELNFNGNVKDDVKIVKSDNGIVTFKATFTTNEDFLKKVDTLLGTQDLSETMKHTIVDEYLDKYNASIDTSDKQNLKLEFEIISKITSEGIQGFTHSGGDLSKPFTLIKYDAKVGDKYTFTDDAGNIITREVTYISTKEDYELYFYNIKVFKIEETQPKDPLIEKIEYIANHKFGLVGAKVIMKDGKTPTIEILPWEVLNKI